METEHFINPGYGWMCRHCNPENTLSAPLAPGRARFFTEGEAEDKEPVLSSGIIARWRDASRRKLFCPRCGVEELMDKA
ncbi:MAG TPA: hypothetical protein VGB17_15700 [Pyrinomonadaceae bacterium]